jgi:hypothetical protein
VRLIYNSAFAYGQNDGAVWAGRGVTTAVQGGISARVGRLSVEVAPIFFWSQNQDFEMMDNGLEGALAFAHPTWPGSVDMPQRFGDSP